MRLDPAIARRAAQASTSSEVFTKHETRNTNHGFFPNHGLCGRSVLRGCARGGVTRNRRPDHCPHRQVTVFQFTIVHYCSLLFAIVRHCSPKILSCASALAPPGRCFPARCGAAWAAMARHGRPPSPAPATRPVGFLQPRDTQHAFPQSLRRLQGEQPQARPTGFHESRDTKHESRPSRRAAQASANSEVFTRHESRNTNHGFYAFLPTISRHFSGGGGGSETGVQAPLAGKSHKNAQNPASAGRCMGCTVSRGSRRPPGCLGCGQHKMNS